MQFSVITYPADAKELYTESFHFKLHPVCQVTTRPAEKEPRHFVFINAWHNINDWVQT